MCGVSRRNGEILFIEKGIYFFFFLLLCFISKTDRRTFTIPKAGNRAILLLAFLRIFVTGKSAAEPFLGMLLGGGMFLLVYLLSKGRGIGGGDVKLAAAGGAMLGPDILYALFLGCVYAAAAYLWRCGTLKREAARRFAFAPYLTAGMTTELLILVITRK